MRRWWLWKVINHIAIRPDDRFAHLPEHRNPTLPQPLTTPKEDSYSVTRVIDGLNYHLSLTDTAGQEEYRGLWASSNLKSDAFLLVYDITNAYSLDTLDHFMQMIEMESEQRIDDGGVPPVKIVAGNKCDLKEGRVISSRQGLEWARARGCGFMETSAREMVNIEETFAHDRFSAGKESGRSSPAKSLWRSLFTTHHTDTFSYEDMATNANDGETADAGTVRLFKSVWWEE
ncbi:hypothetical protein MMC16_003292 [Acarospora aff. strigata]|nr:hypothetical protein [Acarospora aff. strigata]